MNPFRYSEPVPVEDLIDRDEEAKELVRRAEEGNNSRLVAPLRFGKTSLWRRVIHDADRAGVEVALDAQAESPLLDRLALPRRLHERHGTRTLVVLDEFQDVLATTERADAVIRAEIQHHGDAASYIFAGSHVGMMRELFADRRRAFYGQAAAVELPRLAPDVVADYIVGRFARTGRQIGGALEPLLTNPGSRASAAHDAARPRALGAHPGRSERDRGDLAAGLRAGDAPGAGRAASDLECSLPPRAAR
jgi:hypothetical protein